MENKVDTHGAAGAGWYGFDLDGTLAEYDGWKGFGHIGKPVASMVSLVKKLHGEGKIVKIVTARVAPRDPPEDLLPNPWYNKDGALSGETPWRYIYGWNAKCFIQDWCYVNLGFVPEITHQKDGLMITLYDDRVKQVVPNKGILVEDLVPKPDPDWDKICARCVEEGLCDDEYCEYYGEPAGCNSPIYGRHPAISRKKTHEVLNRVHDFLGVLIRDTLDGELSVKASELADDVFDCMNGVGNAKQ